MQQMALSWESQPQRTVMTVAELNARIKQTLDERFSNLWVSGEISGVRPAASGHIYFTLKDQESQIRCVCWRSATRFLKFKPQDGVAVVARGRVDVFEARGEYQLIVEALEPQGYGALQYAFEQLKRKLAIEGLFNAERKRPLPKLPRRIGLVTSPSGAVIQDMLNVFGRRFPGLHLRLYPATVQGEGSVESVIRGIEHFSTSGWAEVMIVARGGGSLEDLWTFNEEAVARAIVASQIPVVSAIGHETDFSISDFVADLRAPTPSAAAELVICTRESLIEQITGCERHLEKAIRYRLSESSRRVHELGADRAATLLHRRVGRSLQQIDDADYRIREMMRGQVRRGRERLDLLDGQLRRLDLRVRFAETRNRLQKATERLERCLQSRVDRMRSRVTTLHAELNHLSPLAVLDRGYAIVQTNDDAVVRSPEQAPPGTEVQIRLARGRLKADTK